MNIIEALVLARFVHFYAVMVLFGSCLFPLYAVPRHRGTAMQLGHLPRSFYALAANAALASGIAWMVCSFADITGGAANLVSGRILSIFFLQTGFGRAWVVRLVILGVLAFAASRRHKDIRFASCAALSSLLLASQAWLGHAATGVGISENVLIGVYAIHVLAAGAWIGGLHSLGIWLTSTRSGTSEASAVLVLDRFSSMGMVAVPLILLSGFLNAAYRLDGDGLPLIDSAWGKTLSVKLALVLTMIMLAAVNRFVLLPRISIEIDTALPTLGRNVFFEQGLGVIVVAAAAILGLLPPP
jgi:copper resistance protein D